MATQKDLEKKYKQLKTQAQKLKKDLLASGYDIKKPEQLEILKHVDIADFIQDMNGTVYDFFQCINNGFENFANQIKNIEKITSRSENDIKKIVTENQDLQNVIKKINNQIVQSLPKDEKEFEKLSQTLTQNEKTFQESFGEYTDYSKHIASELQKIQQTARGAESFRDLKNLAKRTNTWKEILLENFENTAERSHLLEQVTLQHETLNKEMKKRSGVFHRTAKFFGKHKGTMASIVGAATTQSPLALWMFDAMFSAGERRKQAAQMSKKYKTAQLYNTRDFLQSQETGKPVRSSTRSRTIDSESRQFESGVFEQILEQLSLHTEYLKNISHDRNNTHEAIDEQTQTIKQNESHRVREQASADFAAEESATETRDEKWRLKLAQVTAAGAGGGTGGPGGGWVSSIKDTILTYLGIKTGAGIIKNLLPKAKGMGTLALGVTGAALAARNINESIDQSKRYGVSPAVGAASSQLIPGATTAVAALATGGSMFGTSAGFAGGEALQAILPDKEKGNIARGMQTVVDEWKRQQSLERVFKGTIYNKKLADRGRKELAELEKEKYNRAKESYIAQKQYDMIQKQNVIRADITQTREEIKLATDATRKEALKRILGQQEKRLGDLIGEYDQMLVRLDEYRKDQERGEKKTTTAKGKVLDKEQKVLDKERGLLDKKTTAIDKPVPTELQAQRDLAKTWLAKHMLGYMNKVVGEKQKPQSKQLDINKKTNTSALLAAATAALFIRPGRGPVGKRTPSTPFSPEGIPYPNDIRKIREKILGKEKLTPEEKTRWDDFRSRAGAAAGKSRVQPTESIYTIPGRGAVGLRTKDTSYSPEGVPYPKDVQHIREKIIAKEPLTNEEKKRWNEFRQKVQAGTEGTLVNPKDANAKIATIPGKGPVGQRTPETQFSPEGIPYPPDIQQIREKIIGKEKLTPEEKKRWDDFRGRANAATGKGGAPRPKPIYSIPGKGPVGQRTPETQFSPEGIPYPPDIQQIREKITGGKTLTPEEKKRWDGFRGRIDAHKPSYHKPGDGALVVEGGGGALPAFGDSAKPDGGIVKSTKPVYTIPGKGAVGKRSPNSSTTPEGVPYPDDVFKIREKISSGQKLTPEEKQRWDDFRGRIDAHKPIYHKPGEKAARIDGKIYKDQELVKKLREKDITLTDSPQIAQIPGKGPVGKRTEDTQYSPEGAYYPNDVFKIREKITAGQKLTDDEKQRWGEFRQGSKTAEDRGFAQVGAPQSKPIGGLGAVSAKYESGKGGAGTISSGVGDAGGKSYGTFQLASKTGTAQKFIDQSPYAKEFAGLKPGTPAFDAKWKEISGKDSTGFEQSQKDFIAKTHFEPAKAAADKLGFKTSDRGVSEAIYSASVQHGGVNKILEKTAKENPNFENMTSQQQIEALYKSRGEYADQFVNKAAGSGRYEREKIDALAYAGQPTGVGGEAGRQPQPSPDQASTRYAMLNNDLQSTKMKTDAAGRQPVVVNAGGGKGKRGGSGGSGSGPVSRKAPRGNEPTIQVALNTDFSGSSA